MQAVITNMQEKHASSVTHVHARLEEPALIFLTLSTCIIIVIAYRYLTLSSVMTACVKNQANVVREITHHTVLL